MSDGKTDSISSKITKLSNFELFLSEDLGTVTQVK